MWMTLRLMTIQHYFWQFAKCICTQQMGNDILFQENVDPILEMDSSSHDKSIYTYPSSLLEIPELVLAPI